MALLMTEMATGWDGVSAGITLETFPGSQHSLNGFKARKLTHKYQLCCPAHLNHLALTMCNYVHHFTLGFDSGLYSGRICISIKVPGRDHRGEGGLLALWSQDKL